MNKEELKRRAIALEHELKTLSNQSADIAAFAEYEPLVNAIARAKADEISEPEEMPGMYYWKFETDMFWNFKSLGESFARFNMLLRGLEL